MYTKWANYYIIVSTKLILRMCRYLNKQCTVARTDHAWWSSSKCARWLCSSENKFPRRVSDMKCWSVAFFNAIWLESVQFLWTKWATFVIFVICHNRTCIPLQLLIFIVLKTVTKKISLSSSLSVLILLAISWETRVWCYKRDASVSVMNC